MTGIFRRILALLRKPAPPAEWSPPPLTGERARIDAARESARRNCQCQQIGRLNKRMAQATHDDLRAGLVKQRISPRHPAGGEEAAQPVGAFTALPDQRQHEGR